MANRTREADAAYMRDYYARFPEKRKAFRDSQKAKRCTPAGWAQAQVRAIRHRAKANGLECTISASDIVPPLVCPVLGLELRVGTKGAEPNSPSVDRFDNSKGYVPENVRVISNRANLLKKDATLAEMQAVVRYMETLQ